MSDENRSVTPVAFFVADFNLSSWESDNLTFTLTLGHFILISNEIHRMCLQHFYSFSQKIQDSFFDFFKNEEHLCIPNTF